MASRKKSRSPYQKYEKRPHKYSPEYYTWRNLACADGKKPTKPGASLEAARRAHDAVIARAQWAMSEASLAA